MKFIHLSDLHIGKKVYEFSMLDDQKVILDQILDVIDEESPDAVMIAGDIYDKPVPTKEAVEVFDKFLVDLLSREVPTFIISGNHDSAVRLAFGNKLMDPSGIHFAPVYDGTVEPFQLQDEYGDVNIYMLPFIKPASVRWLFPDEEMDSYTDMMRVALRQNDIDPDARNILVAHQFITGAVQSDSEDVSVGGLDNIDASVFKDFDYVALGHIHKPQNIETEKIRYAGTPLKYSFSEADHDKSVTIVELGNKGDLNIREVPLHPVHDMIEIKGTYEEIKKDKVSIDAHHDDYVHVTLTDELDVPGALEDLREIYPKLMKMDYDNKRTQHIAEIQEIKTIDGESPFKLFSDFYEKCNENNHMTEEQADFVEKLIEEIWEAEE